MSQALRLAALPSARRPPIRAVLAAALLLGVAAGWLATPEPVAQHAAAQAGAELTRLLRMMALLKLALAIGAVWLTDWRLRYPARPALAACYVAAVASMACAPGLIWSMAHVIAGAALLHGGLAALLLLLWRDPGSPAMLQALRRRAPLSE